MLYSSKSLSKWVCVVNLPPLKPIHADSSLLQLKLEKFRQLSTDELITSLRPGQTGSLKVRPDGAILDGHHRIKILRERGINVDGLPREIIHRS